VGAGGEGERAEQRAAQRGRAEAMHARQEVRYSISVIGTGLMHPDDPKIQLGGGGWACVFEFQLERLFRAHDDDDGGDDDTFLRLIYLPQS
jgi:hypothetical protein